MVKINVETAVEELRSGTREHVTMRFAFLHDCHVKALAEELSKNTVVRVLNLDDNRIRSKGAEYLADALRTNHNLKRLNLNENDLGDIGVTTLAKSLRKNSTLEALLLMDNKVSNKGMKALSAVLDGEGNSTLSELDLEMNSITKSGAGYLAKALEKNTTLQGLLLGYNDFGDRGCHYITEAYAKQNQLRTLRMASCGAGHLAVEGLARPLRDKGCTLMSLDLSENVITDECAAVLFGALTHNLSLQTLRLNDNPLTEECCVTLGTMLSQNITLKTLDLSGCDLADQGMVHLSHALPNNNSLKVLQLNRCNIRQPGVSQLGHALYVGKAVLHTLELDENRAGELGVFSLCEALENNPNIAIVSLNSNNLTPKCIETMARVNRKDTRIIHDTNFFGK